MVSNEKKQSKMKCDALLNNSEKYVGQTMIKESMFGRGSVVK